jgi:hypothetical protein
MAAESQPGPLDVVAALEHQMATFDQLVGLLKANRAAVEQALVEATRKVWVVTPAQAPSAGYSPGTQLPYLHVTGEGLQALRESRGL